MQALRQAFERHSEGSFPQDDGDEQSSELHAELAELAGYVAGRITTVLGGGGRLRSSDLKSDDDLRRRLEALAASSSPGANAATRYLTYLDELDALLILARGFAH